MSQLLDVGTFLLLGATLSACGVAPQNKVKVPVPVEWRVMLPTRPAMPTEGLRVGVDLDLFSASAMAEIELREGYERELEAVLVECVRSVSQSVRMSLSLQARVERNVSRTRS